MSSKIFLKSDQVQCTNIIPERTTTMSTQNSCLSDAQQTKTPCNKQDSNDSDLSNIQTNVANSYNLFE